MVIGDGNQAWFSQVEAAGRRYAETAARRRDVEKARQRSGLMVVDTPEQIIARSNRLMTSGEVPVQAVLEVGESAPLPRLTTRERIIDRASQSQAANFLSRGVRAAATVARISLSEDGREIPAGTGSLISARLLLTNNHVLPDVNAATGAVLEFRAEMGIDHVPAASTRFRLDPAGFFVTDVHLDFTVVLVAAGADGRSPGDVAGGWNQLIVQQGKIVVGESMNIIGHPSGRLKEISIRDNHLDLQLDDFLHYSTDTEPGNSGSPVYNDQWEVVALHHSGVARKDAQGRELLRDGRVWRPGDSDDAVDWIANEGVRVSVILKHLAGLQLDARQRTLLAELGAASGITDASTVSAPAPPPLEFADVLADAAAPRIRGVTGRAAAFGGTHHLLFLHGRGQGGRDPVQLRRGWTAGLNQGLTLAGLAPLDPADIYFPFYGDVLATELGARESVAADAEISALFEQLVAEAAGELGMPAELDNVDSSAAESFAGFGSGLLSRVQRQLSWIAARSGLDGLVIAQIFKDVASYLDNERTRGRVLDTVIEAVPRSGRLVLVSHSLGTVVGMDLLSRLPAAVDVELFVTAGSPLGLDAVYKRLVVPGPHRPDRIGHWLNAWYAGDPVAIGCPLSRSWAGQLQEIAVDNSKERAHDIAEYLGKPAVAGIIRQQLTRP